MLLRASLALFAVLFVGCTTSSAILGHPQETHSDLRGMVYDYDRLPVSGAQITLRVAERTWSTTTDIHGRFSLGAIPLGDVTLECTKEKFEPFRWSFLFGERSQVVYVQMANLDQLFNGALEALERKEWNEATLALDRADRLQTPGLTSIFLRAQLLSARGDHEAAMRLLEGQTNEGQPVLAFELALADLYEKKLQLPDQALRHLEQALKIKYDSEVEERLRRLVAERDGR